MFESSFMVVSLHRKLTAAILLSRTKTNKKNQHEESKSIPLLTVQSALLLTFYNIKVYVAVL